MLTWNRLACNLFLSSVGLTVVCKTLQMAPGNVLGSSVGKQTVRLRTFRASRRSSEKVVSCRSASRLVPKRAARALQSWALPGRPATGSPQSLSAKSCAIAISCLKRS